MTQQFSRLVAGVYRIGQVFTRPGSIVTSCTAYNRNTNDVVGLHLIALPPTSAFASQQLQSLFALLERRRQVHSPTVLPLHTWGLDGSWLYLVTDPPRGVSLRYLMDHEHIDLQRALEIVRQLLKGVEVLQAHGFVGLDLRPSFITVQVIEFRDYVQVDDLGLRLLVHALGLGASQQSDDIGFFDPRYLAPEELQGQPPGPWSDVYHAGLLLFELVAGRPPFVGRTIAETAFLQTSAPLPSLELYHHNTPNVVQALLEHALAKQPTQRFASIQAFLNALNGIQMPPPPERVPAFGEITLLAGAEQPPSSATREIAAIETADDLSLAQTLLQTPQGKASLRSEDSEEGVLAYLCFEGGERPLRLPIRGRNVVVGRADPRRHLYPDLDLTPLDSQMVVSRQHARIHFEETFFYIEDLKSHNGTWLGGLRLKPLKAELLQHGDHLRFGSLECIFRVPGQPDPPRPGARSEPPARPPLKPKPSGS
ncbi:protein kinase domain-containing protein [Thermogemmatispora onikobensis]|uniref:protein kinase domain-containing protein n=1 Tax=Thermogemmatispora onikobensis TaxID=732234 RepID=UPI000852A61A|nr:FHA domain-containing protein [Thermogemmatispora onikobensis]